MPPVSEGDHSLPVPPDASRLAAHELVEVRDRLADAGLHDDGLGPGMSLAPGQVDAARLPLVLSDLRARDDTRSLLTRVFAYGDTTSAAELEAALGSTTLDRLAACNLLGTTSSGALACPILLRPLTGLIVASDRSGATGDAVMPPGPTTASLVRALPRPPLGRVLDLGTGSGVLALLAAATGAAVTATDITARACAFTRFNSAFNGLAVDVRHGDLFEPVAGEQFDLVVSQPPFVVEPPGIEPTVYVHGGRRGDELALRILRGLHHVLAAGGWGLLRFDAPGSQEDVVARVRAAVAPDLDVGVFGFTTVGPDMIALSYAVLADPTVGHRYQEAVARYHRHMLDAGLDHFTGTVTAVHRPAAPAEEPVTLSVSGRAVPQWPYIVTRFGAERLAGAGQATLLAARLAPVPGATLNAELGLDEAGLRPTFVLRYPAGAVATDLELNEAGAAMFQLFAGGRALADVVSDYAAATGRPGAEAAADVVAFARDALSRGHLLPTDV